jgi:hypothetical protein
MRILLTRRPDGGSVLRCERTDGTATWQSHQGKQARFFPLHDLTHYAVETSLHARQGFFGLVAAGWDIEDTGGKGARGPLPPQALLVERIVGMLDLESASNDGWSASDYVEQLTAAGAGESLRSLGALTDAILAQIRSRRAELFARWASTPVGATLELEFDASSAPNPR